MKRLLILFLSAVLFLPTFGNMVVYTVFKINQNEISKTICIQRKMPNNSCQGHCQLKKNLKELEENEKRFDNNLKEKFELVYIQTISENNLTITEPIVSKQKLFTAITGKPVSVNISTFHPPSFLI